MTRKGLVKWMVVIALMVLGTMLLTACSSEPPTEGVRQQAFMERHGSEAAKAARQDEFKESLDAQQPSKDDELQKFKGLYKDLYGPVVTEAKRAEEFKKLFREQQPSYEDMRAGFGEFLDSFAEDRRAEYKKWFDEDLLTREEVSKEDQQAGFRTWHDSLFKERRAEIEDVVEALFFNGEHEQLSTVLNLAGVDVGAEVMGLSRRIVVKGMLIESLKDALKRHEVDDPSKLDDHDRVLPDGRVQTVFSPFNRFGYLGPNGVILDIAVHEGLCSIPDPEDFEKFMLLLTAAPHENETYWKGEPLFEGTAREFCEGGESAPTLYPDKGIMVFDRPEIRLFSVPDASIRVMSMDKIKTGGLLLFAKLTENEVRVAYGMVLSVQKLPGSPPTLVFMGLPAIAPTRDDKMAAVYAITGNKDAPLALIAFITSTELPATARSAEVLFDGLEGFPYTVE